MIPNWNKCKLHYNRKFYKLWYFWNKSLLEKVYFENLAGAVFKLLKYNYVFQLTCAVNLFGFPENKFSYFWTHAWRTSMSSLGNIGSFHVLNRTLSVWPTLLTYECFSCKHLEIPLVYCITSSRQRSYSKVANSSL